MSNAAMRILIVVSFSAALIPTPSYSDTNVHAWKPLSGISTPTGISVAGFIDNAAYAAGVTYEGEVRFTSTHDPANWPAWSDVASAPSGGFHPQTAPLLVDGGRTLFLLARGADSNLYQSTRTSSTSWTAWRALTNDGSVHGRITAAITRATPQSQPELHVAYPGIDRSHYRRFFASSLQGSLNFDDVIDATVGSDDSGQVLLVLRKPGEVGFVKLERYSDWLPIEVPSRRAPDGVFDISNVVYYDDGFNVTYAGKELVDDVGPAYIYRVRHLKVVSKVTPPQFVREVHSYQSGPNGHALVQLAVYRNKLVLLMRDEAGNLRASRLDNADPTQTWIPPFPIEGGRSSHRPSLALLNARDGYGSDPGPYDHFVFGNELLAGAKGISNSAYFSILSRAWLKEDVRVQMGVWNSHSDSQALYCQPQSSPTAPTPVILNEDGRPYLTEVGYSLWMFPRWFIDGFYRRFAESRCSAGMTFQGRMEPPCSSARLPVILQRNGSITFCSGVWVDRSSNAFDFFQELGHYMAISMGLQNDQSGPTAADAARVKISLPALHTAYSLFTERTGTCFYDTPRCIGFTGFSGNYDNKGREHSFIYVVLYYVQKGDTLRAYIQDDEQTGVDLLRRKYDWVKTNIFRGVEFREGGAPF